MCDSSKEKAANAFQVHTFTMVFSKRFATNERFRIFSDLSQVEVGIHGNKQIGTMKKAGLFSMNVPTWHRLWRNAQLSWFACRMSQDLEGEKSM